MATSYLDKTGLAHFWSKIKAYFMRRNLVPEQTKTYTGVIASANSDPAGFLYFGSLKPVDYNTPWRVRYRMYITIGGLTSRNKSYYDVEMRGMASAYWGWDAYNQVDTSYRPLYYHLLRVCTSTGISNGYGHLIGLRLQSSYNPATAANARTVDVQIIDTENCTFTFFDTMTLYANVPGTGSTNYSTRYQFDGANCGHKMLGDSNSQGLYMCHQNNIKTKAAISNPSLIVGDIDGFCRVGSGVTFDMSYPILWCNTSLAEGASNYANVFTRNYDLNIASGAKTGFTSTANKMIYLVVTVNGKTATIDSSVITDTLPSTEDGKVYILLGKLGNQSTGANYFILYEVHPMFVFTNGAVRQWTSDASTVTGHTVEADVPSGAKFTDTTYSAATSTAAGLMSSGDFNSLANLVSKLTDAGMIGSGSKTISLGQYQACGTLTASAGDLYFSIPTGRVFPSGTTLTAISFKIGARAANQNGAGMYIIKDSASGVSSVTFNSANAFTFYNGASASKTVAQSNIQKLLYGQTNILIHIVSGANGFSGNATNTGYINNQPVSIWLTDISITVNLPS